MRWHGVPAVGSCISAAGLALILFLAAGSARSVGNSPAKPSEQPIASESEMNLGAYRTTLERVSGLVAGLDLHPTEIAALRESLPKAWTVRAAGERFEVSTGWLSSALETMERNPATGPSLRKEIQARLRALEHQAEAMEQTARAPAPEEARGKLEIILSRPEFRSVREPSWWDRARQGLGAWVLRMLEKILGSFHFRSRGGDILAWIVIAAAFVLLALSFRRSLLRAAGQRSLELEGAPSAGKTWRDWAQQAFAAAARNNYRQAVHAAYWAGVYRLAELGAWQLDRSRTPREYLGLLAHGGTSPGGLASASAGQGPMEIADHAQRASALAALTRTLELTWYGYHPATRGDFGEALSQLEALGCRFPSNLATASS